MSEGATAGPNKHVKAFIAYYAALPQAPRYAVMLNGAWGIGKTFLLKAFLDTVRTEDFQVVYVSLNGLKSSEDIERALFRAMYPLLNSKAVDALGKIIASVGKFFRAETNLRPIDFFNSYTANLYVFDDIERCAMPIDQTLGYINGFVEHGDRKVILVANEAEIRLADDYRRIREKLIGRTLEIQADFDSALTVFLQTIRDPRAREFLVARTDVIGTIYTQSGLNNLRILQQTMWDFERFYCALEDKHRADDAAMTALLRMLFALSMEFKAGQINADDLRNRSGNPYATAGRTQGTVASPSSFDAARARYPEADFADPALSDGVLTDLLVKGVVDAEGIRADLDASSYFVLVADEPAWRTVWYGIERTDAEVADAFARMEAAFAAREYIVPGEILHVFGLRLRLSRIGALTLTLPEIVAECRGYVDDLYAAKRLEPATAGDGMDEFRSTGYGGLAIASSETPEYRDLYGHFRETQKAAAIDSYPDIAGRLMQEMTSDLERFVDRVTFGRGASGDMARIPVLSALDVDIFVATLLALHPSQQRTVLKALKARYDHSTLKDELARELPWAQTVRQKLIATASMLPPFGRERIEVFLAHTLDTAPDLRVSSTPVLPPPAASPPSV
ncbi:UNVERIFIED_ORG: hypothetical protein J2W75_004826 [Methylorubrum zatmanii]|uniref:P-loop NTPase fold protein n=1 Tax=Methylorubrum extorquens TaxID=408 RepID=UPI0020A1DF48|nr:P-loop NTPase fold protein [Methylorubrum extorquens]MCP1561423.1 hypothetical protein [Methylorubrum extorquens]